MKVSARQRRAVLLSALLLALLVVELHSAHRKSLTWDEPLHFSYGQRLLHGHTDRIYRSDNSKMPSTALNVLPGMFLQSLGWAVLPVELPLPGQRLGNYLDDPLQAGRVVTMVASLALVLLVYAWSRELYGCGAGWLGFLLAALSPNLLAHARLITTDLYAALAATTTLYLLWRFLRSGRSRDGLLCALAMGLAQVAKYTCVTLLAIVPLVALAWNGRRALDMLRRRDRLGLRRCLGRGLWYIVLYGAVVLFVINSAFLWEGTGTPLANYKLRSETMRSLQLRAGALAWLPIPLPRAYVVGLDYCKFDEERGPDVGIYLCGQLIPGNRAPRIGRFRGFPDYFVIAAMVKLPIATMLLVALAAALALVERRPSEGRDLLVLLIPLAVWGAYFTLAFQTQLGLRYVLPALPLLFVLASGSARAWGGAPRWRRALVPALAAYVAASSLSYHPHYLSYFNEIVLPRTHAYRWLADSNVDWLQNQRYLDAWMATHPEAILRPPVPVPGTVVVDINRLVGVIGGPQRYAWLRENFEPVSHVAYSYLVYEVSPEALSKLSLRTVG